MESSNVYSHVFISLIRLLLLLFEFFCRVTAIFILYNICRYKIIKEPTKKREITNKKLYLLILITLLIGIFWAVTPVFGWSQYKFSSNIFNCTIQVNKRTSTVLSYYISKTIFVYLIPIILLFSINFRALHIVIIFLFLIIILNNCLFQFIRCKKEEKKF